MKKITEIFNDKKLTFSFELFPPKTAEGYNNLLRTITELAKSGPDFFSCTYGAGGGYSARHRAGEFNISTFTKIDSTPEAIQAAIDEIKRLQALYPGSFTAVGIDIDPYENEAVVRKHQSDNRFYGLYAVAPAEMIKELTNEFGVDIISPASAPMVLICSNGTVTRLDRGVKSAEVLDQVIRVRC